MKAALNDAARKELDAMLFEGYEYQSDFARKYVAEGEAKGKAEGRAEGEAKGKVEGEAKGKAEGAATTLLRILELRGLKATETERARILTCQDIQQLERWTRFALQVESFQDLFAPET